MITDVFLTRVFNFRQDDFKILNNLQLFKEDGQFAGGIFVNLSMASVCPMISAYVLKQFNIMRTPRCFPNLVGRSVFHAGIFGVAFSSTVSPFYQSKIDQLNTPVGHLLRESCEKFKSTDHIVQQFHSQKCRRLSFEDQYSQKLSIIDEYGSTVSEFIMYVLVARKLKNFEEWQFYTEFIPQNEMKSCPDELKIKSEDELKSRIKNLRLTATERELIYRIFASQIMLLALGFLILKPVSALYKAPFRELKLIGVLGSVVLSCYGGRKWWIMQDSPLSQIVRDHYFGERRPDLMLARAELKQTRHLNAQQLEMNSFVHKFVSFNLSSVFNDVLQHLYKYNFSS